MTFKIAVLDKSGKFLNFLCEEHRYIGNIWLTHLQFRTRKQAEIHIKQHHSTPNYYWEVVEAKTK